MTQPSTWFFSALLAALPGSAALAKQPPTAWAQGNAPGWITINYDHPGNDDYLGFALEADKRGIVSTQAASHGQFADTNLTARSTHTYRVCAIYENSELACSDWVTAQTTALPVAPLDLNPPTIINHRVSTNSIQIFWGATGSYRSIKLGWSKIGSPRTEALVNNVPNSSYTVENLEPGATYHFALQGFSKNSFGNDVTGPWSPSVDITVPLPELPWSKPVLKIKDYSTSKVTLEFSATALHSRGQDLFVVYRDTQPIQHVKPEGAANPGLRTGTFTEFTTGRHEYNVCITEDGSPRANVCSNGVRRPVIPLPPPPDRILSNGPSPATGCVDVAGGCGPKPPAPPAVNPMTCLAGFVWREAFSGDVVCVTPQIRAATFADNSQAEARHLPGSTTCKNGFVWREARPNDLVCVTPQTRTQTALDNSQANKRRVSANTVKHLRGTRR